MTYGSLLGGRAAEFNISNLPPSSPNIWYSSNWNGSSCTAVHWPPLPVGQGQMVKGDQGWPRVAKDGQGWSRIVGQVEVAAFSSWPLSSCCSTLYITVPSPWPRSPTLLSPSATLLWWDVGRRSEATLLLLLPTRCPCQRFGGIFGVRRHQFIL